MGIRNRPGLLACVVVLVFVAAGAVAWVVLRATPGSMQASSAGAEAGLAAPGVEGAWRSDGETVGAWIQRSWERPVDLARVSLELDDQPGIEAGYLRFSDGSRLFVQADEQDVEVAVEPRTVSWMRFTVTQAAEGATSVAVASLDADDEGAAGQSTGAPEDGDVARTAAIRGADQSLVDGREDTGAAIASGVELTWDRPQELTRVEIAGAATGATLSEAEIEFSDGSTLPVGAVQADPARPTVLAFMPRSTTSLRLVPGEVDGDGAASLSRLSAYTRGAPPAGPPAGEPTQQASNATTAACPEAAAEDPPRGARPVVLCPTNGTVVGDSVQVTAQVGPGYTTVTATPWGSGPRTPAGEPVVGVVGPDGTATMDVDVSSMDPGPFTVSLSAVTAQGQPDADTHLQLARPGPLEGTRPDPAPGRTVVFEDDFTGDLSASRTDPDTDYVAGKPEPWGVTDFGEAIFADPAAGWDNLAQEDGYLRLSVLPRPAEQEDFMGWERDHLGGLIASARQGGSGFSTQYGYFEARMLAPATPGTWPAFWTLSTPNLVAPQPVTAEVDAVELYGHDPVSACHTSHQYPDPQEVGEALCGRRWPSTQDALRWHTYGVDIQPDRLVYYVDGEEVGEAPPVEGSDEPMFFLVNLALGGGWPVELEPVGNRASLYVDWVRVQV